MTTTSWYRRSVWNFKGSREYSRAGFETASLRYNEQDLEVDCSDRHFMITGANSGLGLATAVEIAKRGGVLHLVCRNAKAMKEARSHIITTTGNDKIFQHQVNLSKPREVVQWTEEFLKSNQQLDVLINNAGVLLHQREVDEDDNENMFTVNVLSVHLITLTLLPLLQRSNDPRVIIVSSAGMLTVKLDITDLNFGKMKPFNGRLAYSQTKRQQVVMNFCYAQRHERVKFYSMHPGWADTPGVRNSLPEFYAQMKDNLRTSAQGADTIVWLSVSKAALQHSSGLFFQDRVPIATHLPLAWTRTSSAEEQQLMVHLDELFGKYSSLESSQVPKTLGHRDRVEMNGEQESILCHPSDAEQETILDRTSTAVTHEQQETENAVEAFVAANELNSENGVSIEHEKHFDKCPGKKAEFNKDPDQVLPNKESVEQVDEKLPEQIFSICDDTPLYINISTEGDSETKSELVKVPLNDEHNYAKENKNEPISKSLEEIIDHDSEFKTEQISKSLGSASVEITSDKNESVFNKVLDNDKTNDSQNIIEIQDDLDPISDVNIKDQEQESINPFTNVTTQEQKQDSVNPFGDANDKEQSSVAFNDDHKEENANVSNVEFEDKLYESNVETTKEI